MQADFIFSVPVKIPPLYKPKARIRSISLEDINQAAAEAKADVDEFFAKERQLLRKGYFQQRQSTEAFHQAFFGPPNPEHSRLARDGLIGLRTTITIMKKYYLIC